MPPKTQSQEPDQASEGISLTPREATMFMTAVLTCNKQEVTIDYNKLATAMNLKNGASAKAAWHGVKKKVEKSLGDVMTAEAGGDDAAKAESDAGENPIDSPTKSPTKKTPSKRKAASTKGDDGEVATVESPTKKSRAAKGKKKAATEEPEEEVVGDA